MNARHQGDVKLAEPMNLKDWEARIQKIADEANHEPNERFRDRILIACRAKLTKEQPSLPRFQIDRIMREVRKRLTVVAQ